MTNTLNDFILKYEGKSIDADGAYGAECVDVIKQYCLEVFGCPIQAIGNASDLEHDKLGFFKKYGFYRVDYRDLRKGDIVFFALSKWGHVGILDKIENTKVFVYDQVGNGDKVGGELPFKQRSYRKSFYLGGWRGPDTSTAKRIDVAKLLAKISPGKKIWGGLRPEEPCTFAELRIMIDNAGLKTEIPVELDAKQVAIEDAWYKIIKSL